MNSFMSESRRGTLSRLLIIIAILAAMIMVGSPPQPAAAACGGETGVSNEAELNAAISAYNGAAGPCVFTIRLTQDINLTASTTIIDNGTAGVELVIEGDGHAVDGQDNAGVRPFRVDHSTTVTINDLTIRNGNVENEKGGGIFNDGTLTINDSRILENVALGFQSYGGGIHNGGTLTVVRTIISDNDANSWNGGGIDNGGNLMVIDSTISGNSADRGGGIYNNTGSPVLPFRTVPSPAIPPAGLAVASTTPPPPQRPCATALFRVIRQSLPVAASSTLRPISRSIA